MWSDELFGWMLVSDPSWAHMLRAWNLGADGGGIVFYSLCRIWLLIFGTHVLAFRFFSAAGVYLGFAATWFSLRRFYRPAISGIALSLVWFGSRVLLWHMFQTRFYGLLVGLTACALYISLRSAADTDGRQPAKRGTLLAVLLLNFALVGTHPFGFVFGGLILLSAFVSDLLARRKRPLYYVTAVLSWTVLLFSHTAIKNSGRVGKPWFWTTKPSFSDLRYFYRPDYLPWLMKIAVLLFTVVLVSMFWKRQRTVMMAALASRRDILIPGLMLMATPICFWLVSLHGTSYFVDRYFCSFTIGVAIFGAELLTYFFAESFSPKAPVPLLLAIFSTLVAWHEVLFDCMVPYAQTSVYPPRRDWTGDLAAMLPRNEPIVIQRADIFDLMVYYRSAPDLPMYSPLDWSLALSPESPKWLVSAMHEMENWKFAGYFADRIVYSDDFLRTHSKFVVVADEITPWFNARIATQPGWHVRKLGVFDRGIWASTIWEVTR